MSSVPLAVIGGGHLGRIHARLAATVPGLNLVGIVEPHPESRARLQSEVAAPCYAHLDDVLGRIQAAIIAAPTEFHHKIGMQLISHGKHLLIEKPLASTSEQALELASAASKAGVVLQVGHVEQFNPAVRLLPTDLGPLRFVNATRQGPYTFRSTDISVVMDLMIHDLDLVLAWQNSKLQRIHAVGYKALSRQEDAVHARLEFVDGCVAQLFASRVSPHRERTMEVIATNGSARLDFAANRVVVTRPHSPSAADPSATPLPTLRPGSDRQTLQQQLFSDLLPTTEHTEAGSNAIYDELVDFSTALHSASRPAVDGHRGWRAVELAERIVDAMIPIPWFPAESMHVAAVRDQSWPERRKSA